MIRRRCIGPCAAVLLTGLPEAVLPAPAAPEALYIQRAVADAHRPAEDRASDPARKPAQCLAFAGIAGGSIVLELVPGSGYFTRLLSVAVGPRGRVYAVVPPRRADAPADAPDPAAAVQAIARDPHYRNVTLLIQRPWTVVLPAPADLAWTSLNYHDFHNVQGLDVRSLNEAVWRNLRPGASYVVLDHVAAEGSGTRDTGTLHRIDAQAVVAEVQAAGFELRARGHDLANAQDTRERTVFDPAVRGHTDQFMLRFSKPDR